MNTVTIKAKALLAAKRIANHANGYSENRMAAIIESCFTPDSAKEPIFKMAPFSGIVGCGIFRIADPAKIVCIIPSQCPEHLKDKTRNELRAGFMADIKIETERVARIILTSLNESLTSRIDSDSIDIERK